MRRGGGGYGRGGGGLYGNFVSANDNVMNKAYRGAEIPPPPSLTSGNNSNNRVTGGGPRLGPNTPIPGITPAAQGRFLIAHLPVLKIKITDWYCGLVV